MDLSLTERLILANQYRILELIDERDTEFYKKAQEIVREGWELEYDSVAGDLSKQTLSGDECAEVHEILVMFQALSDSFKALDDTSGVEESEVSFQGFSGNDESCQLGYLHFLLKHEGDSISPLVPANPNSHFPALRHYREKLRRFNDVMKTRGLEARPLTREELLRIIGDD